MAVGGGGWFACSGLVGAASPVISGNPPHGPFSSTTPEDTQPPPTRRIHAPSVPSAKRYSPIGMEAIAGNCTSGPCRMTTPPSFGLTLQRLVGTSEPTVPAASPSSPLLSVSASVVVSAGAVVGAGVGAASSPPAVAGADAASSVGIGPDVVSSAAACWVGAAPLPNCTSTPPDAADPACTTSV